MNEKHKKLPKIDHPIFSATLPSTGEEVKYRTFTVKEEKILLIAQETNDVEQAILSVKQVVNNCLVDKDVDELSMFDLEYMLLTLRAKSVDNKIEFSIKDPDTQEDIKLTLDLEEVKVVKNKDHTNKIKVDDTYTLIMRYPTVNEFAASISKEMNEAGTGDANYKIMTSCMESLVSYDDIFLFSEFSEEEILEFTDDLSANAIEQLKKFFDTMPKLRHEIKYKNSSGDDKTFVIEGMETFFI